MMNNEAQGPLPLVPFDVWELQGIERVLWAYLHYLRRLPASPKNVHRRRSVARIQQRLAMQLSPGHVQDVQLFLTREDLEELLEALREFARLIQHFFPKNEERDVVIETVTTWQRRLTRIVAEFET
jgi:hypothetical protein